MQLLNRRIKAVIACYIIIAVCLLSSSAAAQQAGSQAKHATVSDDDFIKLQQQITELKDPTFRAFLRMRLLSWERPEPGPVRRQAAIEVATQGVRDLCEHQDEIWAPTASWLHRTLVKQIEIIQSPEAPTLELCVLKPETKNVAEKDFASATRMLRDPETSAAGLTLARAAVLSGQVSPEAMLGQLLILSKAQSPHLSELLNAVLALEENRPGALTLRMMPFFSSLFLEKHVAQEIRTRFLSVAVRYSRVRPSELAIPMVGSQVVTLLNGIILPAKQFAPELYPEIASRLSSLNGNAGNRTEARLAAEERIQKASDQLDQLISEANSASDQQAKEFFFFRAARLAKEQGQLSKAVDLAMKSADGKLDTNSTTRSWLNDFLSEIVSLAVKKNSPREAPYAISKMTGPLAKANAFRLLGQSYGENQDKVKSKEAFNESAKQLKSIPNSNEKIKACLLLAESVLKYEPADAYEAFRESVRAINNLPSPEKGKENTDYSKLLPVAEDLIRSFRLLAIRENQTAITLAAEIKLSELRVSALAGTYSAREVNTDKKF